MEEQIISEGTKNLEEDLQGETIVWKKCCVEERVFGGRDI